MINLYTNIDKETLVKVEVYEVSDEKTLVILDVLVTQEMTKQEICIRVYNALEKWCVKNSLDVDDYDYELL